MACEDNLSLIPGITGFRDYLAMRGLTMGLATSSHRKIYTRYCELNAIDFFHPDYVITHGEAVDDKPQPGQFVEIMRRMHVEPKQTLVIEDSGSGITAGRHAGATVLAVATTKSAEYLRTQTGAHIVTGDFPEAARALHPILPE